MGLIHGGAKIAFVEYRAGALHVETYESRLALILAMMDNGAIGGGVSYGDNKHLGALQAIENHLAVVRGSIARQRAEEMEEEF